MSAPQTKGRISARRVRGRHVAAQLYAEARASLHAAGREECSARSLARHYEVTSKHLIADWGTPDSGAAITLGDLLAGPTELARAVLRRALEHLDEGALRRVAADPRDEVLRLTSRICRTGDRARECVEDDDVTAAEWSQMAGEFEAVERDAAAARRACEAAAAKRGER